MPFPHKAQPKKSTASYVEKKSGSTWCGLPVVSFSFDVMCGIKNLFASLLASLDIYTYSISILHHPVLHIKSSSTVLLAHFKPILLDEKIILREGSYYPVQLSDPHQWLHMTMGPVFPFNTPILPRKTGKISMPSVPEIVEDEA